MNPVTLDHYKDRKTLENVYKRTNHTVDEDNDDDCMRPASTTSDLNDSEDPTEYWVYVRNLRRVDLSICVFGTKLGGSLLF